MENVKPYYLTKKGKEEIKRKRYERSSLWRKEMMEIAKELGNCSKCFKEKDNPKFKFCSKCREYQRNYMLTYQRKKGEKNE